MLISGGSCPFALAFMTIDVAHAWYSHSAFLENNTERPYSTVISAGSNDGIVALPTRHVMLQASAVQIECMCLFVEDKQTMSQNVSQFWKILVMSLGGPSLKRDIVETVVNTQVTDWD